MGRSQRGPGDGGVGHDQRIDPMVDTGRGNILDIGRFQVGRDLQENGRPARRARGHYGTQQRVERTAILQRAQARRIGRRNIDRQIISERCHAGDAGDIVGNAPPGGGRILVRADIDADHGAVADRAAIAGDTIRRRALPTIVEPEPVDHRLVLDQPEQARLRIARLGQRRQRSQFGKAKAKAVHLVCDPPILVITRRQSDRIGKADARHHGCQHRIGCQRRACRHHPQRSKREMMGTLGIERKQQRADQTIGHGTCLCQRRADTSSRCGQSATTAC